MLSHVAGPFSPISQDIQDSSLSKQIPLLDGCISGDLNAVAESLANSASVGKVRSAKSHERLDGVSWLQETKIVSPTTIAQVGVLPPPLLAAAEFSGRRDILELLLKNGANVNDRDEVRPLLLFLARTNRRERAREWEELPFSPSQSFLLIAASCSRAGRSNGLDPRSRGCRLCLRRPAHRERGRHRRRRQGWMAGAPRGAYLKDVYRKGIDRNRLISQRPPYPVL